MSKKKALGNNRLNNYLKFQLINLFIYTAVFSVLCCISLVSDMKKEAMAYMSLIFLGVSSFLSGFSAGIRERKNGLVCGILSALPFNALFIITALLLNRFSTDINLLISVAAGLASSAVGGIVSVNVRLK